MKRAGADREAQYGRMRSKIRLVVRSLLPAAAELQDLRARLLKAHTAAGRWKERFERQSAEVHRLKAAVQQIKEQNRLLDRRSNIRKHAELSHAVLGQLLPVRAIERPVLAADAVIAAERAQRLLAASTDYGKVLQDADARVALLERVHLEGVPWWLPRDEAAAGRATKLQEQGFPLRAILQTREVALGGVMLDLGANIGRTSIARMLLGDVRAVYAAEPEPINYACLVQNIVEHELCGFVLPDRVAIGAARGEVWLRRSPYIGGHRVLSGAFQEAHVEAVAVQSWPLDEWMPHVGADPRSVSFVKVDTQGCEADVLRGARELLARRHVAWQVEVDPALLQRAGSSMNALLALFQEHFTHFIDIGTKLPGSRSRPVNELPDALAYVGRVQSKTDLVLYNAAGHSGSMLT